MEKTDKTTVVKPDDDLDEKEGVTKVTLLLRDVYNSSLDKAEANAKRWFKFSVALLLALVFTNIAWLVYELQYDNIVITQDANTDSGGNASVTGAVGDVIYGTSTSDNSNENKKD